MSKIKPTLPPLVRSTSDVASDVTQKLDEAIEARKAQQPGLNLQKDRVDGGPQPTNLNQTTATPTLSSLGVPGLESLLGGDGKEIGTLETLRGLLAPQPGQEPSSKEQILQAVSDYRALVAADPSLPSGAWLDRLETEVPLSVDDARGALTDAATKFPELEGKQLFLQSGKSESGKPMSWIESDTHVVTGDNLVSKNEFYRTQRPQLNRITDPRLLSSFEPTADGSVKSMMVVGQGPTGLLTSILTKLNPANKDTRIVHVEKRGQDGNMDYTRPIALGIRQGFLDILASAKSPVTGKSAYDLLTERDQVHYFEAKDGVRPMREHEKGVVAREAGHRVPDGARPGASAYGPAAESSVAMIKTAHLEQALADIAKDIPKLHLVNGFTPTLEATDHIGLDGKPMYGVALQQIGKVEGKWSNLGEPIPMGVPDLVVATDGARSKTVAQTDIGLVTGSSMGEYIAAEVQVEEQDNNAHKMDFEMGGRALTAYINTTGKKAESWMILQSGTKKDGVTPPGDHALKLCKRMIFEVYYKDSDHPAAAKVEELTARGAHDEAMQVINETVQIKWGGHQPFTLSPSMVETAQSGNFVTAGDATGNNTFAAGAGTNVAGYQALSVARGITKVNEATTRKDRGLALKQATDQVWQNAWAWHRVGPDATREELQDGISQLRDRAPATEQLLRATRRMKPAEATDYLVSKMRSREITWKDALSVAGSPLLGLGAANVAKIQREVTAIWGKADVRQMAGLLGMEVSEFLASAEGVKTSRPVVGPADDDVDPQETWNPIRHMDTSSQKSLSPAQREEILQTVGEIREYVETHNLDYIPVFGYLSLRDRNHRELGAPDQDTVNANRDQYIIDGVLKDHSIGLVLSTLVRGTPTHPGAFAGLSQVEGADTPGVVLKIPITRDASGNIDHATTEKALSLVLQREAVGEADLLDTVTADGTVSNALYRPAIREVTLPDGSTQKALLFVANEKGVRHVKVPDKYESTFEGSTSGYGDGVGQLAFYMDAEGAIQNRVTGKVRNNSTQDYWARSYVANRLLSEQALDPMITKALITSYLTPRERDVGKNFTLREVLSQAYVGAMSPVHASWLQSSKAEDSSVRLKNAPSTIVKIDASPEQRMKMVLAVRSGDLPPDAESVQLAIAVASKMYGQISDLAQSESVTTADREAFPGRLASMIAHTLWAQTPSFIPRAERAIAGALAKLPAAEVRGTEHEGRQKVFDILRELQATNREVNVNDVVERMRAMPEGTFDPADYAWVRSELMRDLRNNELPIAKELSVPGELPIFGAFPGLRSLPRAEFMDSTPTPIESLSMEGLPEGKVFVKRDDATTRLYGGNKPRKLEFLLGEALKQGATDVITNGNLGSNHAVATAKMARDIGLSTTLVLTKQPQSTFVEANVRAAQKTGANIIYTDAMKEMREAAKDNIEAGGRVPYVVPGGGKSPLGEVGWVNAAFELAQQVENGEIPEPKEIWVSGGTGGTTAGLLVGLKLAGLDTRVRSISVSPHLTLEMILKTANDTLDYLRAVDPSIPNITISEEDCMFDVNEVGEGFGLSTPASAHASEVAGKAGVPSDPTFTAKALAALLSGAKDVDGPVLYWNTFNGVELDLAPTEELPENVQAALK